MQERKRANPLTNEENIAIMIVKVPRLEKKMKKRILAVLLCACLCLAFSACGPQEATAIFFTMTAEAEPATDERAALPAISRTISFPVSELPEVTVMQAVIYGCEALGHPSEREGKYSEILVSLAERKNGERGEWVIEGKDTHGNVIPLSTDDTLEGIVALSVTYLKNN